MLLSGLHKCLARGIIRKGYVVSEVVTSRSCELLEARTSSVLVEQTGRGPLEGRMSDYV